MLRRRFIRLSVAGAAVGTLPLSKCGDNTHLQPALLDAILGKAGVKDIGKGYLQQFPDEAIDEMKLRQLLESESNVTSTKKIARDFTTGKTVIVNGWILSLTEARQSALFYINS